MAGIRLFWDISAQEFPAGTVADHAVATLSGDGPAIVQDVALGVQEVFYLNLEPGTYQGSMQLVDAVGAPLGAPAETADIVVTLDTVFLDVPVNARGEVTA